MVWIGENLTVILQYFLPHPKLKTRPLRTWFLASGDFVYLPPYIPHLHNIKNPVQIAGFMVFCLIPPHIPSPTQKWKTCPYGTCFLGSDGFVYISPWLLHVQNTKNPVQMAGFMVFCLIPPYPIPHPKMENMPIWDVFSGFGWLFLPFPIHTPPPQPKKPSQKWLGFGLLPHPHPFSPPTRKLKTHPSRTCFLASGEFAYLPPCILYPQNPKTQSEMAVFWVLASSPPISPSHPKTQNLSISDMFSNGHVLGSCLTPHIPSIWFVLHRWLI